jgi:hypothetical protein
MKFNLGDSKFWSMGIMVKKQNVGLPNIGGPYNLFQIYSFYYTNFWSKSSAL